MFALAAAARGDDGGPPDANQNATGPGPGGSVLTAVVDGGADDTAGPTVHGCIYNDQAPLEIGGGIKHFCQAQYDVEFSFDIETTNGPDGTVTGSVIVNTSDESDYVEPLVMACCDSMQAHGWQAPNGPTCGLPHTRACYADLVENACKVMEVFLRKEAADAHGLLGNNTDYAALNAGNRLRLIGRGQERWVGRVGIDERAQEREDVATLCA